jgi:hypothetical protein
MDPKDKLHQDIKRFFDVYKFLPSEGKAQFEAQITAEIKDKDQKTKNLYCALLKAAKDGEAVEDAIEGMGKAAEEGNK